jgi:hypothetical protein
MMHLIEPEELQSHKKYLKPFHLPPLHETN